MHGVRWCHARWSNGGRRVHLVRGSRHSSRWAHGMMGHVGESCQRARGGRMGAYRRTRHGGGWHGHGWGWSGGGRCGGRASSLRRKVESRGRGSLLLLLRCYCDRLCLGPRAHVLWRPLLVAGIFKGVCCMHGIWLACGMVRKARVLLEWWTLREIVRAMCRRRHGHLTAHVWHGLTWHHREATATGHWRKASSSRYDTIVYKFRQIFLFD